MAVGVQEDIVQLQVPVDDPSVVQEVESDADLGRVEPGAGHPSSAADPMRSLDERPVHTAPAGGAADPHPHTSRPRVNTPGVRAHAEQDDETPPHTPEDGSCQTDRKRVLARTWEAGPGRPVGGQYSGDAASMEAPQTLKWRVTM